MSRVSANLRKAAVFIRSLDVDTAATVLSQLSSDEAVRIREAMRNLGPLDADEQADVLAELQHRRVASALTTMDGVELELSSSASAPESVGGAWQESPSVSGKRFESLESAPVSALVTFLSREHAQTVAVVLSHLEPARAASVLSSLPQSLQVDTIERIDALGESDPDSVTVLEKELADWVAKRTTNRKTSATRSDKAAKILAAVECTSCEALLRNIRSRDATLADRITPHRGPSPQPEPPQRVGPGREQVRTSKVEPNELRFGMSEKVAAATHVRPRHRPALATTANPQSVPTIDFDHLIHLDTRTLAIVLREVDANVLALALAGSSEELVDRICDQMPKQIARRFRRELRQLGPTRLSDVEMAQQAVARSAAQHLAARRRSQVAAHS